MSSPNSTKTTSCTLLPISRMHVSIATLPGWHVGLSALKIGKRSGQTDPKRPSPYYLAAFKERVSKHPTRHGRKGNSLQAMLVCLRVWYQVRASE